MQLTPSVINASKSLLSAAILRIPNQHHIRPIITVRRFTTADLPTARIKHAIARSSWSFSAEKKNKAQAFIAASMAVSAIKRTMSFAEQRPRRRRIATIDSAYIRLQFDIVSDSLFSVSPNEAILPSARCTAASSAKTYRMRQIRNVLNYFAPISSIPLR